MATKPLSVVRSEYMEKLYIITNNSGLPAFVILDVLEHLTENVRELAKSELARDTLAYKDALKAEQEKKENESEVTKDEEGDKSPD